MDKRNVSERSRLLMALTRFATQGTNLPQSNFNLPEDKEAILRAVLTEIDETVLSREITLTSDTREKATLNVSNRRLVSLKLAGETPGTRCQSQPDPNAAAQDFVENITAMAERCAALSMQVSAQTQKIQTTGISCSASSLADAAGLIDFGMISNTSLSGFLTMVKDLASAWIMLGPGSGMIGYQGPEASVTLLKELSRSALESGAMFTNGSKFGSRPPSCMVLPLKNSTLVTILAHQDSVFLALTTLTERQSIVENWHAIAPTLGAEKT